MNIKQFNIRVYGILMNENDQVLVADELVKGNKITKFPGGGLEFGEGTIDCLKREFMEETNMEVEVTAHFYTTDFFQQSAFHKDHQIISIYYLVKPSLGLTVSVKEKMFDFKQFIDDEEQFRWINLKDLSANDFTLPIDKIVGEMLREKAKKQS